MRRKHYLKNERKISYYRQIIERIFDGDFNYDNFKNNINKNKFVIKKAIESLRLSLKHYGFDITYLSGEQSYGYKSIESIESTYSYISDRFMCGNRLTWMLGVLNTKF
jgi:hypothetical protein